MAARESWMRRGAPLAVPVLVAAGLLLVYKLLPILELTAVAALLALILRTLVLRLGEMGVRPWAATVVLFGLLLASGAFVWLVVLPSIFAESVILASNTPGYVNSLAGYLERLQGSTRFGPGPGPGLMPDARAALDQLEGLLSGLTGSVPYLLSAGTNLIVAVIATVVLALYMACDPASLVRAVLRLTPHKERKTVEAFIRSLEQRLRGWMAGMILAMLIVGAGAGVGLWALGVPLALTFGILAGVLELIPCFGQIIAALLPALVALTVSPLKALLVLALFLVLNLVDNHLVQPLVTGRRARLHPVVVILSFLAFGELLGFVGVLLAVPAAAFLVTLAEELAPNELVHHRPRAATQRECAPPRGAIGEEEPADPEAGDPGVAEEQKEGVR